MTRQKVGNRRGANFTLRLSEDERRALEESMLSTDGAPRSLGPFLVWSALPRRRGNARSSGNARPGRALPGPGSAPAGVVDEALPIGSRVILDLCAGTGAWSEPYKRAGYKVVRVTLPRKDVRTFVPPSRVWGVLAAPPCTEFSRAKRGERDFVEGMACVNACLRIVLQAKPNWWALENPVGKLALWLGRPRDVFNPCDFGDPWTKLTALWGEFSRPERGPFVRPAAGKLALAHDAVERSRTPHGFARAFFEANP